VPISKNKKTEIVKELGKRVGSSETIVFVNFHGLPVNQTTELRQQLYERGVGYKVVKKTLIRRSFESSGRTITGTWPDLDGEIALTYLNQADGDPLAPAKGIYEFQKKSVLGRPALVGEGLRILGGVFQGAFADSEIMMMVAAIPSREVLYAQLVNLFHSPIQRLVVALDHISKLAKSE